MVRNEGKLNRLSVSSVRITPVMGDARLASATGFIVRRNGEPFLVTNRHVVTALHNETGEHLDADGSRPTALLINYLARGSQIRWLEGRIELFDDGLDALWLEHPTFGPKVDIVALRLAGADESAQFIDVSLEETLIEGHSLLTGVPDGVMVVGYPLGLDGGDVGVGIWTQGTIATELRYDQGGLPRFLIDSRTREGLSGAPVYLYVRAGNLLRYSDGGGAMNLGDVSELLGIYSGRVSDKSDLGYVWKARTIIEIVDGNRRGTPH